MIYRLLSVVKHIVFGFFRILCWILRCGRRKKVQVDDSLPTDIVIGDAVQSNLNNYAQSGMNGFEMTSPPYYNEQQTGRHPFQSQLEIESISKEQYGDNMEADIQMQSWDQWGFDQASTAAQSPGSQHHEQSSPTESPQETEIDFFADMEPSVKVKKIFVKKKRKSSNSSDGGNRLALNQDLDFQTTSELDAWQEEDLGGGWDGDDVNLDEIDAEKVAREARELRKQERMQRSEEQKKLKLAKKSTSHKEHRLGMKVS